MSHTQAGSRLAAMVIDRSAMAVEGTGSYPAVRRTVTSAECMDRASSQVEH